MTSTTEDLVKGAFDELNAINAFVSRHYVCEDQDVTYDNMIVMEHESDSKKVCVMQPFIDCTKEEELVSLVDRLRKIPDLNKSDDMDAVELYLLFRYILQANTDLPTFNSISDGLRALAEYSLVNVKKEIDLSNMGDISDKKRKKREQDADDEDDDDSDFIANDSEEEEEEEEEEDEPEAVSTDEEKGEDEDSEPATKKQRSSEG